MEIHRSARRHGVTDADIAHAVDFCLCEPQQVGDNPPYKTLYIGPDRAGNLLEIVALELDSGVELVIHAMKMRSQYMELLRGRRRS